MNSMSKGYYNDDCDHGKKEKKPCPTIIKCSCPSSTTIPAAITVGTSFTVSSLTLDTSSLSDPCTKLEFASNLVAPVLFSGTINFQVFKLCKGQVTPVPVGPSWTFTRAAGVILSDTFTFFVCDCDSCIDDCCTYTVVATVTAVIAGGISINNSTLGAISTCRSSKCC
ncbi:hypothetical protein CLPUN_49830 [Clostridium puniceum]|uniref:DUF4489 domain-containing protein n=1 Tax=Clostridium puniceum TaxID=29367 RepID=A0A1S8T0W5_9CLOT|nr:DUF4489 domain-containing protein [Clostridium puniceum]OOM71299.1 hypothetical protein CLPUN_49830 [Clostridium puniceum]